MQYKALRVTQTAAVTMTKTTSTRSLFCLSMSACLWLGACEPAPAPTQAPEVTPPSDTEGDVDASSAIGGPDQIAAPKEPAGDPTPPPEPEPPADPYGPVSDEVQARFAGIESDPKPPELTRNSHYWVSNERSQFLWYEALSNKGGIGDAYIGVGTDQNYMLAGWAKSNFIVLMDFDQAIVNLHQAYRVFFAAADTPEDFLALWTEEKEAEGQKLIAAAYPNKEERKPIARAYKIARKLVYLRLKRLKRQYPPLNIPTFVTDQEQYDHIKKLSANGRVHAVRGDLTADQTMQQIGIALRDSDMKLGVLYFSNAEQYFEYTPAVRRNVLAQPFSDASMVVRTLGWESHGFVDGEEYHYNIQAGLNFAGWMKTSMVSKAGRLLRHKTMTDIPGNSVIKGEPQQSARLPEIAEEQRP
jgi:hypothetical protein